MAGKLAALINRINTDKVHRNELEAALTAYKKAIAENVMETHKDVLKKLAEV